VASSISWLTQQLRRLQLLLIYLSWVHEAAMVLGFIMLSAEAAVCFARESAVQSNQSVAKSPTSTG
jgi:hypothetical protein